MRSNYRTRSTLLLDQRNHGRSKCEELRWTRNCTDELANPSIDLKMRKRENLPVQIYCGGMPRTLVRFRLMQRPLSMQFSRVEGGGGASELEHRKDEEEGTEGEERKGPSGFIYKEKGISGRRKNRGAWSGKEGAPVASIFGIPLMKGIFLIFLYRDDVMMIRCCVQRMTSRRFNKVYMRRLQASLQKE